MKVYNTTLHTIPFPGCEKYKLLTDEYWECQVSILFILSNNTKGTSKVLRSSVILHMW